MLFTRWVVGYQTEISFGEFKAKLAPIKIANDEQTLAEVERIMTSFDQEVK